MKNSKVFLNNKFLNLSEAKISPLDRGFIFADGVYELIPFFQDKAFLLDKHLLRLNKNLSEMKIENIYSNDEWRSYINKLISYYDYTNFYVYIQVSRGAPKHEEEVLRQHHYYNEMEPTIFMYVSEINLLPEDKIRKGFSCVTLDDLRWGMCNIKSISLAYNALAKNYAKEREAFETVFVKKGIITEGSSSNIFIVKDNVFYTPQLNNYVLPGITRGYVIEEIKNLDYQIQEIDISIDMLEKADEAFLTNSTQFLVPISSLNKKIIGSGQAGKYSCELYEKFKKISRYS